MKTQKELLSDTKTRIMDVAERLFTKKGFQGTSIKRLAREAKVNQAAVNYYFGSKAALIEKVIDRRLGPVTEQRMRRLESLRLAADWKGGSPLAEDVLRAFIEPAFIMNSHMQEHRCILALAAWAFSESDEKIKSIFLRHFIPPFRLLVGAMKEALSEVPEDVLVRRLHFAIGAMTHGFQQCGISLLPHDLLPPVGDVRTITELLLEFVTSGMIAPCHGESRNMLRSAS